MSSLPQPAPQPSRGSGRANELLRDALQSEANAKQHLRATASRIEEAHASGATALAFSWETPDGRDAELHVYVVESEEPEVLVAELRRLDFREPTARERVYYEDEFAAEMAARGDLWLKLASRIFERPR